ncbi:hypothetical protein DICSQDRAFT_157016 [Dichomitus squalens LYAD-421 SS1]|uniref:Uncharacterized protein n=1 Tax=Dichomitus squalens (strain LYAD-421) TaxID=732165 RepID=R7SQ76_DICSQ|nr:uncharacterized protein DICSQDRAFT_157016 [Dichomitus squalens LYAD-421 SS1]EJF58088.1 hypothetical protein DICSQDRAFT_157016 [Dichomitus squalens LYAD-421 SS1]
MLDDFSVDKRDLHRRVSGGVKRLNKRWVYTPTAIFTPAQSPATTSSSVDNPFTGLFPPPSSSSIPATTTQPALPTGTTTSSTAVTTSAATTTTTISSSTLSSTTSTSSSSSTSPTATLAPTTSTPTIVLPQTVQDATTEVDITVTPTHSTTSVSATSLAASPTTSTTPKSGVSTGVLIGGIIAIVVAVAGILFAVVYFIRRSRKSSEEDDFNPDAFRRQSMMLPDTDSISGASRATPWSRGGARPPTMIEQKLAHNPVSYVPPVPPHPYTFGAAYNESSFSPGQVYTPTTTNSANPFFSPYDDRSPIGTPAPSEAYATRSNTVSRQPSMASTTVLSRHSSNSGKPLPDIVADDYVDMNRSSVTPFQAAQYADISRRLNTTPPQGLPLTEVEEEFEQAQEIPVLPQKHVEPLEFQPSSLGLDGAQHLTVQPTPRENAFPESPFADPEMAEQQRLSQRDSTGSILQPPEPIFDADAPSPKARIASIPPMLPELTLQDRPFSPVTIDFPIAPSSVRPSPSPFSTMFTDIPSSPPKVHFPENATEPATPSAPVLRIGAGQSAVKRPDTVYTLYDDEDAYAGI